MRRARKGCRVAASALVTVGVMTALAPLGTASPGQPRASAAAPPAGAPAPARLVGLWAAHFTDRDEQTSGTWHLRIGPGHHLKIWNRLDGVANTPSFEGGPVSFRGDRMTFAKTTAEGVCVTPATYAWTLRNGLLRFRLVGRDNCSPRIVTFTPHPWHRSS